MGPCRAPTWVLLGPCDQRGALKGSRSPEGPFLGLLRDHSALGCEESGPARLPKSCRKAAEKLPKSCRKAAGKLPKSCRKAAEKLPKSCRKGQPLPDQAQNLRKWKAHMRENHINTNDPGTFVTSQNEALPAPKKDPNGPNGDPLNLPKLRSGSQKAPELEPQPLWAPDSFRDSF